MRDAWEVYASQDYHNRCVLRLKQVEEQTAPPAHNTRSASGTNLGSILATQREGLSHGRLRIPGLAERLRSARQAAGLTQERAAEVLSVARRTVYMWESGRSAPSRRRLETIASVYGKPANWFLAGAAGLMDSDPSLEQIKRRIARLPSKYRTVVEKVIKALEDLGPA